jgi:hypothetical protein
MDDQTILQLIRSGNNDLALAHDHSEWLAAGWAFERYDTFLRTRYPDSFSHDYPRKDN